MASAGVSRSGRVRKKSAKLIEMETEVSNTSINNNNNNSLTKSSINLSNNSNDNNISIEDDNNNTSITSITTPDPDLGKPLKKKLKIKLSLSGNTSAITSQVSKPFIINEKSVKIDNINSESINKDIKKATIPPLKIPKSKITGMSSPVHTNVDTIHTQSTPQLTISQENTTLSQLDSVSVEPKTKLNTNKKAKNQLNKKEVNDSKPEIKVENEMIVEKVDEKVEEEVEENVEVVCEQSLPTITNDDNNDNNHNNNDNTITETPKVSQILKPKKKEHESAANRLFRQITSGVATPVTKLKTKGNKKKKSFPLEDLLTVSYDEDFEETSLVIATEDLIKVKPKNKRSRPTKALTEDKKSKKAKNLAEGVKPKKKRSVITAYMLWSKEHRSKIQQTCPDKDFADVSRKLGEIWQSMKKKEKTQWKRKAQKLTGKGSSIISTGKPKLSQLSNQSKMKASFGADLSSELLNNDDYSRYTSNDEPRPIGTSPIDVSAHLRLLGESLSLIGQRLKEHSGQIAVSGSLSVLLDSTLCAIGPLLCLTQLDPKLDGCPQETHKKTLDNIAYIMPGI